MARIARQRAQVFGEIQAPAFAGGDFSTDWAGFPYFGLFCTETSISASCLRPEPSLDRTAQEMTSHRAPSRTAPFRDITDRKPLVANRSEIAIRILRAANEAGLSAPRQTLAPMGAYTLGVALWPKFR